VTKDDNGRAEWLRLMLELGRTNREAYREIRSQAWALVAKRHAEKTPEEIAAWVQASS
jgi:hypothetical protein